MTGEIPQGQPAQDPVAVARALLQAEAARRGISVKHLVDRLAREGRRPVADVDRQSDLSQWTATVTGRRGGAVSDRTVTVLDGTGAAK